MQIQKRSLIHRGPPFGLLYLKPLSKPNQWNHGFFPFNPSFSGGNFLARAIEEHREVFVQLMPVHTDGQITNVRGHLSQLRVGQYVIQTGNLSYFFELPSFATSQARFFTYTKIQKRLRETLLSLSRFFVHTKENGPVSPGPFA